MSRGLLLIAVFAAGVLLALTQTSRSAPAALQTSVAPTFSRDIAPILYRNCVSCHRPGEIAPMSLLTWEQARPYARAIRERIQLGSMPPWHAEASAGTFTNERRLSDMEKEILVRWVNDGAPQGDPKDLPPLP